MKHNERRNEDGTWVLSPREKEMLFWAAKGKTYNETATISGLTFGSVKTYLDKARMKLNAVNVTHAVSLAYETGLIPLNTVAIVPMDKIPDALSLILDVECRSLNKEQIS